MGVCAAAIRSNSALRMGAVLHTSSANMIFCGMRERSTMRAASGSNQKLNSAAADALPGTATLPPMKTMRLMRVSMEGFRRSANAMLVMGPVARMVTSPGRRSISEIRNWTPPSRRGRRPVSLAPGAGFTSDGFWANAPVNSAGPHRRLNSRAMAGLCSKGVSAPR